MLNFRNIVIAGAAGQGVDSAVTLIGKILLRTGFHLFISADYQSRVRGGHNFMRIRFGDQPLTATVSSIDYLLALNEESLERHLPGLKNDGVAFAMADDCLSITDPRVVKVPAKTGPMAARGKTFTGIKLLALLFAELGLSAEIFKQTVNQQFAEKFSTELLQTNLDTISEITTTFADRSPKPLPFAPDPDPQRMLVNGNDAIALGMVAAGVGVYTAYPMTPSTSVLNVLADCGPQLGIAVEQVEDEIAALNAALGASYAGARAATGSSGAGICLMAEAIGMAGITEIPIVIFDAQRSSPATGMATRTEQADLLFVAHVSHGDFPRLIISPAGHSEAFYLTTEAFNLADYWQIPVFILSDQAQASAECSVNEFELEKVNIDRGIIADEPQKTDMLRRYEVTKTGVSPRAFPKLSQWLISCDSHEHNEIGRISDDIENRNRQHDKRMRKLTNLAATLPGPEIWGAPADNLLICWGSTVGPVLEAAEIFRAQGHNLAVAVFQYLYPFNCELIEKALAPFKSIYTIEGNYSGQLGKLLQMETTIRITGHFGKTDGRLFTVEDVLQNLTALVGGKP
ncbi:MAG: 2-oxoacid:acceptor oxidoreductase subunit alpha [Deltaproteobacteria bacterium]|nr:2-oxoacid:acceptor oxidoreductase subunit alpha [Deltaproteobacteria bacterium]